MLLCRSDKDSLLSCDDNVESFSIYLLLISSSSIYLFYLFFIDLVVSDARNGLAMGNFTITYLVYTYLIHNEHTVTGINPILSGFGTRNIYLFVLFGVPGLISDYNEYYGEVGLTDEASTMKRTGVNGIP